MIGLAAMVYEPLYHGREVETIKLSSGCSGKQNQQNLAIFLDFSNKKNYSTSERASLAIYRDFTQTRRRRQKKTWVNKRLNEQNKGFARAWQIVIHIFAVLGKTTTWNDQIQGVVENVNTWRFFFSFSVLTRRPFPPALLLNSSATLYKVNELE